MKRYNTLRVAMQNHGIDQTTLADELGISVRALSNKLNAHSAWTSTEMYDILSILQLPPEQLHVLFPEGGREQRTAFEPVTNNNIYLLNNAL